MISERGRLLVIFVIKIFELLRSCYEILWN